ncbi:MAG: hypothetical protein AAB426_02870 [Myxococcota bacterium]
MHRRLLLLALFAALGCGSTPLGDGIGQPPASYLPLPHLLPLTVREVYRAATGPDVSFVEIANDSTTEQALANLSLCDAHGCQSLAGEAPLPAAGEPGSRRAITVPVYDAMTTGDDTFALVASVGEVALADQATGVVHSYLAWGADPSTLTGSWQGAAVLSGVTEPGDFVPVAWPMPPGVAVAGEAGVQGCAAPSPNTTAILDDTLCDVAPATVRVNELFPGAPGWIELYNEQAVPLSLYGARLCVAPHCTVLTRAAMIPAGGYVVIEVDLGGDAAEVTLALPGVAAALAATGLLSYVRYGDSAPTMWITRAVAALLWEDPSAAAAPPTSEQSLTFDAASGSGSAAWRSATPSRGLVNTIP